MNEYRGNGYYECEHGRFDASLVYDNKEIARTYGELILAYDRKHIAEITEWANEYGYDIEWRA